MRTSTTHHRSTDLCTCKVRGVQLCLDALCQAGYVGQALTPNYASARKLRRASINTLAH